jgi:hypothetical protein
LSVEWLEDGRLVAVQDRGDILAVDLKTGDAKPFAPMPEAYSPFASLVSVHLDG